MNTFWVYENIRKQISFYTKLDVLLLLSSVRLWKRHHPNYNTVLYADSLTIEVLENLNAIKLWDEVHNLPENMFIYKSVFWASSKLQVLRNVKGPSIIMDHDFLVYTNLSQYFKDNVVVTVEENGKNYYPTAYDPFMRAVKDVLPRPKLRAINCSFLYFPTNSFCNYYAEQSLSLMEKFTKLKVPNSRYLIVSEQLLLKHLLDKHNIRYNSLMKAEWNCVTKTYDEYPIGIFNLQEYQTKFKHYWMEKPKIRDSKDGFDLTEEITILKNILSGCEIDFSVIDDFK